MKVWITTGEQYNCVEFHPTKPGPDHWGEFSKCYVFRGEVNVCRDIARRLLKGTGIRLPRHEYPDIREVNLKAEKP